MTLIHDISIRLKLILLAGTAVVLALLMSSTGIIVNDFGMIRSTMIAQLEVQARMMEFNSDGVLAFHDAAAARNYLRSLSLQPAVETACLLDTAGEVFAAYTKLENEKPIVPLRPLKPGTHIEPDGHIEIVMPVKENDHEAQEVGTLYIRANSNEVSKHLGSQVRFIVIVSLLSLIGAILLTMFLQRAISSPIVALTQTAETISRTEDYSIRVHRDSKDELGILYRSFNRMLDALRSSHQQMESQAKQLSLEVGERTRAEADLMVAKEAAEASDRAKSEFLANMSHEIRTPLTGILGFTDVLVSGGDEGDIETRNEYLSTIQTSGRHLLELINDILDLSKVESGQIEFEKEPCYPHVIVADAVRVLQAKAEEKGLNLSIRWVNHVPETIRTDAARLRQLLINLVGNSIKFTAKGYVEIVGQFVDSEDDPLLQIDVIDTGMGIPTNKLECIFDPFVQADNSVTRQFGGTGLGLAISRRIAKALGGNLTVESTLGFGSKFTVRVSTGNVDGIQRVSRAAASKVLTQEKERYSQKIDHQLTADILLVDDGATNRKLIKLLLERAGASVTTAENGEIGLKLACQKDFDLILMDMQMPVLDGYSAARQLRQLGHSTPIIALTAHAMKGDREKCLDAGCSDYLTKPIEANQLFEIVTRELAKAENLKVPKSIAEINLKPATSERPSNSSLQLGPPLVSSLPTEDPDFAEIVIEFIDQLERKLVEIDSAFNEGRLDDLAKLAHWLKGSGGTVGFAAFSQPAANLESSARQKQTTDMALAIETINSISHRIVAPAAPRA